MKGTNINENRLFNSLAWFPAIGLTMVWFASFLAVYLCDHFGYRITCFMGGILCIAGLLATSFAKSPAVMYFKKKKIINIYIAQIPCEYVQMRVTNKYERAN